MKASVRSHRGFDHTGAACYTGLGENFPSTNGGQLHSLLHDSSKRSRLAPLPSFFFEYEWHRRHVKHDHVHSTGQRDRGTCFGTWSSVRKSSDCSDRSTQLTYNRSLLSQAAWSGDFHPQSARASGCSSSSSKFRFRCSNGWCWQGARCNQTRKARLWRS